MTQVMISDVTNVDDELVNFTNTADVLLFAAGYEPRCTHVAGRILGHPDVDGVRAWSQSVVLSFEEFSSEPSHIRSCEFFDQQLPGRRRKCSVEAYGEVISRVHEIVSAMRGASRAIRVLVDYSSMSRMWYLPLMAHFLRSGLDAEFLMSYSVSAYRQFAGTTYPVSRVGEIRAVPGFEGVHHHRPRVHAFGLGYDGAGALALYSRLEADRCIVFWANPGVAADSARIAQERNAELIEKAQLRFSCDLRSVKKATDALSRVALELEPEEKLVVIPIGPKPHVLASGLVGLQFQHVSVLAPHLSGGGINSQVPCIEPSGEIILTRVLLRGE